MSVAEPTNSLLSELVAAVQNLAHRVESLEQRGLLTRMHAAKESVKAATQALFPASVIAMEEKCDPEIEERYVVVRVTVAGSPDEIIEQYREWHRGIGEWASGLESEFRLTINFKE